VVNRNLEWSVAGLNCRKLHEDAHLLIIDDEDEQWAVAALLDLTESDDSQFIVYVLLYCFNLEF